MQASQSETKKLKFSQKFKYKTNLDEILCQVSQEKANTFDEVE